jgi:Flp pilus assembly protein TadG
MAAARTIRRLHDQRGTNLVEAALVTPLLLLVTFAIVDFASLFYIRLALENGASQATRYAITGNQMDDPANPGTPLSREASIRAALRQATPTLTIPDATVTFSHLDPGGTDWLAGTGGPNSIEKVTVAYTWRPITPVLLPFFPGGRLDLRIESTMKNEGRFQ